MRRARWKRTLVTGLVAVVVSVPALVATGPGVAVARRVVIVDPGRPGGRVVVVTPARLALFKGRIRAALHRRKIVFDAAAARLAARLTLVGNITDKVEAAGGDVSNVRNLLSQARSMLDQAKATEAQAVEAFQAVPEAGDKRAAFRSARELARKAVSELKQARDLGRQAVSELRQIVNELKSGEGSTP